MLPANPPVVGGHLSLSLRGMARTLLGGSITKPGGAAGKGLKLFLNSGQI